MLFIAAFTISWFVAYFDIDLLFILVYFGGVWFYFVCFGLFACVFYLLWIRLFINLTVACLIVLRYRLLYLRFVVWFFVLYLRCICCLFIALIVVVIAFSSCLSFCLFTFICCLVLWFCLGIACICVISR